MIVSGFAWHVHHSPDLIEWVWDYEERCRAIQNKPAHEIPLRSRLFKMVKGLLPAPLLQARAALVQAGAAYDDQARATYDQAGAALDQARAAYNQAIQDNQAFIVALHAQECPNCPWDGVTIFSETKAE